MAVGGTIVLASVLLSGINWVQTADKGIGPTVLTFFVLAFGVTAIAIFPAILTGLAWLALNRFIPRSCFVLVPLIAAWQFGGMAKAASNMLAMWIRASTAGRTVGIAALLAWAFVVALNSRFALPGR